MPASIERNQSIKSICMRNNLHVTGDKIWHTKKTNSHTLIAVLQNYLKVLKIARTAKNKNKSDSRNTILSSTRLAWVRPELTNLFWQISSEIDKPLTTWNEITTNIIKIILRTNFRFTKHLNIYSVELVEDSDHMLPGQEIAPKTSWLRWRNEVKNNPRPVLLLRVKYCHIHPAQAVIPDRRKTKDEPKLYN